MSIFHPSSPARRCGDCRACDRHTHRTETEKKQITKKLKIIEGQVRGIEQMIAQDDYCREILIQISAIENSLRSLGIEMLRSHLTTCVARDLVAGKTQSIDEVIDLMRRLNL